MRRPVPPAGRRAPRALRWFVLGAVCFALAVAFFTPFGVIVLGREHVPVHGSITIEVGEGEVFALRSHHDTSCVISPESGETRDVVAERPTFPRSHWGMRGHVVAWFSGRAEVNCKGRATYEPPESLQRGHVASHAPAVLLPAGLLFVTVGFVQVHRRKAVASRRAAREPKAT
ncbi:hypothetical protein GCM10012275_42230 [Longimycelium tulufanense]|uniref:Uncharacterized protein n=1 Tax=Longimycelium tulufanense TaxID=907463 RepID=A0A8J3FWK6_9PSEU|nr:hypothetical protein [Longimycelium tulufanense]GGM67265.1 hypothetical protein GCM10012275_42230 [Longimycelium tulufanense]